MERTIVEKVSGGNMIDNGIGEIGKVGTEDISGRASTNWLMLIYFASGMCSLIDEVVWVRLLKLTLGNTVYASSIVVSTFMGGLALGALIMSRYSDRIRRRLRLYALLEMLITITALALPVGLKFADRIYIWLYRTYHPSNTGLLVMQVIVSGLILLVPSMLMGSTLPLLGRFITSFEEQAGRLVGRLYALNTLGAAAGCFLAGFILIRKFGVMGTLYIAAMLNLFVAFGGWFLSRFYDDAAEEIKTAEAATGRLEGKAYVLVAAFFLSGLISIGYELLWMRSIIHLLSGHTYVFSSVLTIYLLGNVIGAGIGSGLVGGLKRPAAGFAVTLSLLGICGILYLPLMILWISRYLPSINREVELARMFIPFSVYMIKPLAQSAFLFLLPALLMGAGFPLALQAWAGRVHKVGHSTGTAYGANTIGAVAGGVATGFILIPLLGLQVSISILGLTGIWMAVILWFWLARDCKAVGRFGLAVAVLSTVVVMRMPPDLFDAIVKSNPMLPEQLELVEVAEGKTTTVSLFKDRREETLYLYVSGQRVAGDTYFWRSDQKMLGHFGVLLNKRAQKVLSVGFGSGESTACMAMHELERADCVEISPEVVDFSLRFFGHINLGKKLNDEINIIYMDAKNYIHLTDEKYDAIVNDSIHPKHFAENSSLYAREYFEDAKEHLNGNGLFLSWIPTHSVEPSSVLNSIIGTMMEVFPHVTIWYMTPSPAEYFLVAGSQQPQYFSPRHIEVELSKDDVLSSLSEININNSMDVLSCYIGDQDDLRRFIKSFQINSDFQPFIEFNTDNIAAGRWAFLEFIACVKSDSIYEHIDWEGFSLEQKTVWLSNYSKLSHASEFLILANGAESYHERLKHCMDGLAVLPQNPALLSMRKRTEKELFVLCERMVQTGRINEALTKVEDMLQVYPQSVTARMIQSMAYLGMGDLQKALDSAAAAVRLEPDNPDTHFCNGIIMNSLGQLEAAMAECDKALHLSERNNMFAVYSRNMMLEVLSEGSLGKKNDWELLPRREYITEDVTDFHVPAETTRSLAEVSGD